MSLFDNSLFGQADPMLRLGGAISPALVKAIYPIEAITDWHYAHHLKGLTGRWMDGGAHYLTGVTRGSYHRLEHGHHLLEDSFRILSTKDLSFGQFLHHLGLDSLTTRGIPNPLLPTALAQPLQKLGLSKAVVNELMTVNVPKIMGGGLSLVCAGSDVYLAFSDAIPHTFYAAGLHLLYGTADIALGLYPPNALLLLSGATEISVSVTTAYRTLVDPVLPVVNVPASVYFPLLEHSVALGCLFGACAGFWTGQGWEKTTEMALVTGAASAASVSAGLAAAGGGFLAPFAGPFAGIATALLLRKMLGSNYNNQVRYETYGTTGNLNLFPRAAGIPLFGCPSEPIGRIKNDEVTFDERAIARQMLTVAV
ncbi:MAG: hypothetical protein WCJ35_15240 [Planctomycetota bacterium]